MPVAVEHLDARVASVGNEDAARSVARDAVWEIELARSCARGPPGHEKRAVGSKLDHAGVRIAVAYQERPILQNRNVGGKVEVTRVSSSRSRLAERQKKPTIRRELEDLMEPDIAQPNVVAVIHGQSMRHHERAGAPRPEEASGLVEDPDGRSSDRFRWKGLRPFPTGTVKDQHIPMRVDPDARGLPEHLSRRQLRPSVDHLVADHRLPSCVCGARAEDDLWVEARQPTQNKDSQDYAGPLHFTRSYFVRRRIRQRNYEKARKYEDAVFRSVAAGSDHEPPFFAVDHDDAHGQFHSEPQGQRAHRHAGDESDPPDDFHQREDPRKGDSGGEARTGKEASEVTDGSEGGSRHAMDYEDGGDGHSEDGDTPAGLLVRHAGG